MGGDMVVALGRATVEGHTLFGHNSNRPARERPMLHRSPGRAYASGEKVRVQHLELPQARQTYTVLGSRPRGFWGYDHGLNEHGVALGCARALTRMRGTQPGLDGTDLVRLTLERARSAQQAVDVLTDLVRRHGQGVFAEGQADSAADHVFLIADPAEAFAVETGGDRWVYQQVQQVRALGDLCTIRQDWDGIADGLSSHAITHGWWPGDGSKLDFAGALGAPSEAAAGALRRWGRATLLLEQQNGHIDTVFLRQVLTDHYEGCADEQVPLGPPSGPPSLCRHAATAEAEATAVSFIARVGGGPAALPLAWCAFGPPCTAVYFPIFLDGELPLAYSSPGPTTADAIRSRLGNDRAGWEEARVRLDQLQAQLDQETEEFGAEAAALQQRGAAEDLPRLAGLFMEHCLERFDTVARGLGGTGSRPALQPPHRAEPRSARVSGP